MLKKWKKLNSEQVFSHPRHNVFIDDVELPDGHQTRYIHFGKKNDAVMIIPRSREGKILLQKEYSYPPDEILYQFPGGGLENNETVEAGALRELGEEASATGTLTKLGWTYINNRRAGNKLHVFLATELSKASHDNDTEEAFEDFWLSESEIDELIRTNQLRNYSALAGWSFYKVWKNSV
ncbi:MAG: NUDIX hydrolase [Candidatus Saccharibacteria bacterium]|nr:NUDIX hydrolase [Candidatus Saccharibacteria bacterium]